MVAILAFTNLPDTESARRLATALVEQRIAACVNVLSPCDSYYRWQCKVERASEVQVLIKTTRERFAALQALLLELHPYELPELIAVDITAGLPGYLRWLVEGCADETTTDQTTGDKSIFRDNDT